MTDLVRCCIATTGRIYPDGYGMALAFLTSNPSAEDLKEMLTCAMKLANKAAREGNDDGWRFLKAYTEGWAHGGSPRGWPWWLIEAAQLVHWGALSLGRGGRRARACMAQWKHPGF